jgi:hypothetical protein
MADEATTIFDKMSVAEGGGGGGGGVMKGILEEATKCKKKWGDEITFHKGPKGTPFPVKLQRKIPVPTSAELWDVSVMDVTLTITDRDWEDLPMEVDVASGNGIPEQMTAAIAAEVYGKWKHDVKKSKGESWEMEKTLKWVEKKFTELLKLATKCGCVVDRYCLGCNDEEDGAVWRLSIIGQDDDAVAAKEAIAAAEKKAEEESHVWLAKEAAKAALAEEAKLKENQEKRALAGE